MKKISERVHVGGIVAHVSSFEESDRTFYTPAIAPPSIIPVTGRHTTEVAAQVEADQILAANGHTCDGRCTDWVPSSN